MTGITLALSRRVRMAFENAKAHPRTTLTIVGGVAAGLFFASTVGRRLQPRPTRLDNTSGCGLERVSAVIFDVDGTLIDSNAAHAETWALALSEHGFPCEVADVRPLVGMGGDKLLPAIVGVEHTSSQGRAIAERKKSLFAERLPRLKATRGARSLVSYLRDQKKDIVIATSADEEEMLALLEQAGVADLIPRRASKDDVTRSKPDPDLVQAALSKTGSRAARAVMIGDTPYDVEAARRAGLQTIALRCGGYWSDSELRTTAIFDDPAALLVQWKRDSAAGVPVDSDGTVV